ncbi:hypothetical protein [uncultured Ruegeria sp.]|uniref:hypothetical protein n=1 Tax=uncultured Ruegeria sp. TaxID=259304 RepID=UPI0026174BCC|nr:hypothetical protein [uncultured Ruegeria sp.]
MEPEEKGWLAGIVGGTVFPSVFVGFFHLMCRIADVSPDNGLILFFSISFGWLAASFFGLWVCERNS